MNNTIIKYQRERSLPNAGSQGPENGFSVHHASLSKKEKLRATHSMNGEPAGSPKKKQKVVSTAMQEATEARRVHFCTVVAAEAIS